MKSDMTKQNMQAPAAERCVSPAGSISGLPFWKDLTPEEREAAERGAAVRTYENGADIHGFSDACLGLVYVMSGSIRVYVTSEEGREVTLFHLGKGEYCVFSSACVIGGIDLDIQMTAEDEVRLAAIHAGTVSRIMESNVYFKCFVYELAVSRFSTVVWVMQQILFDHFDSRLARLLISEYEKTGSSTIRMTQEEMASEMNSAREVVARMLRQFAREGWISVGRGYVEITDAEALKKIV